MEFYEIRYRCWICSVEWLSQCCLQDLNPNKIEWWSHPSTRHRNISGSTTALSSMSNNYHPINRRNTNQLKSVENRTLQLKWGLISWNKNSKIWDCQGGGIVKGITIDCREGFIKKKQIWRFHIILVSYFACIVWLSCKGDSFFGWLTNCHAIQ